MRWGAAIATVLVSVGSVFAEDPVTTGKALTLEEAEAEVRLETDYLSLKDVTSVTPQVAAALAKHKGEGLSLPDLKSLMPETAAALCTYRGELSLDGLEQLSVGTAQALAKHEGRLSLNSIASLPDNAALALAEHEGGLCMGGLRELRCEPLARQLLLTDNSFSVGGDGGLNPDSLTELSPEVAELLVIKEQDRDGLSFNELKSPSIDVLRVLVRLNRSLHLGITSLTQDMAQVLSAHSDYLDLSGVKEIDKASLEAVLRKKGGLALSLAVVSPDTAVLLAGFRGDLVLNNESLPKEAELLLAKSEANSLRLPNLKELKTADFTRRLVKSRATNGSFDFFWPGAPENGWNLAIEDVSLDIAGQLKAFRGVLKLPAVDRVSNEVAETLSECEGHLILPALRELTSVPLSKKLSQAASADGWTYGETPRHSFDGLHSANGLRLQYVTRISPDVARALASKENECLSLNGLTEVSDEAADALSVFPGILSLGGVMHLSPYAQKVLGQGKNTLVCLGKLKELTDPSLAKKIKETSALETISLEALEVLVGRHDRHDHHHDDISNPTRHNGNFDFPMKELTPQQAAVLSKRTGGFGDIIFLDSVKQLDAASAEELAKSRLGISLCGLREITPEVAAAFANHSEAIYLRGVEAIPVGVAQELAKKNSGMIFFDGRFSYQSKAKDEPFALPKESAAILQNHPHVKLPRYLRRP